MMATTTHPVCRLAQEGDDLSILQVAEGQYVNREQVWVAEAEGTIVGALVMWDGGHSVVKVDNLMTDPAYPSAGPQLILAFNQWCQAQGKVSMEYITPSIELSYHAKRRGAYVEGPVFRIQYGITAQRGASHG